ncbi:MAG TPA: hypothetical protein VMB05_08340, partial [Solirubrobacteraceae bacterium]|nr:hypothetical protein [Solirubrobacteraceae bacterium]
PGLAPGSEGCKGTVANGSAIDTSTPGEHQFTVTATSQDGLAASATVTYNIVVAPTVSITTPAEGAKYSQGQVVNAAYSCTEGAGGPGLKPGSEGCSGTVPKGAAIDTSTAGEHKFTVTADSQDGLTTSKTVSYTVSAPPTVSITTPAEGAKYSQGQVVNAAYSCSEGAGGPGLKPGSEGCSGTVANGSAIDTSTGGEHKFTVTASSQDGLTASKTVSYTVATAPSVSITTPSEGAKYNEGQVVAAAYSCSEGAGGPGLKPGSEGCSGPVANGSAIDTATPGEHKFTVTANSQDGLTASRTVSYAVIAPPSVSITAPVDGAAYLPGQVVNAAYSCSEGAGGPGLKPGSEGCSGPVANGSAIDTATPGGHSFSVTATSADGQSTTSTVSYTVIAPPIFGRCVKVTAGSGKFGNAACTKVAHRLGKWEWLPGPGPKAGFEIAGSSSAPIVLETTTKKKLTCTGVSGAGSVTGVKTATLHVILTACSEAGEPCQSTGTEGEVAFLDLDGALVWSNKAKNALNLDLVPAEERLGTYHCGTSSVTKLVQLSTNGILLPVRTNKSSTTFTSTFKAAKGVQKPNAIEGEAPLLFKELREEGGSSGEEGVGLKGGLVLTYEERYEINTAF